MKRLIKIICLAMIAIGVSSCATLQPSEIYETEESIYNHNISVIYYRQQPYYYYNGRPLYYYYYNPVRPSYYYRPGRPPYYHHHKPGRPPHHNDPHYGKPNKPNPNKPSAPHRNPRNGSSNQNTHRR